MFKRVSDSAVSGEVRECAFCDRVWGFVGIGIGAFLIFTGVDLMLNGKLSARMRVETSPDDLPEEDESAGVLTVVPDVVDEEGADEDDDDD